MPRRVVFALVWLAGTAVAVVLATSAVGMVGQRVTSRPVPRISQAGVEQALRADGASSEAIDASADAAGRGEIGPDVGATSPTGPAAGPSVSARPSGDDRSGSSGGPAPAGSPTTVVAGPSASDGSGSGSTPGGPGPSPTTTPPAPVAATFASAGGSVGVTCTGTTISRTFATPAAGYLLDPSGSSGPSEVDVRFRSASGDHESRIRVSCPSGTPVERIEER